LTCFGQKQKHAKATKVKASCDYLIPAMAHEQSGLLKKRWKKKVYTHTPTMPAGGLLIMKE
jgi:hypothetical protein